MVNKKIFLIIVSMFLCVGCNQKKDAEKPKDDHFLTEDETVFRTANLEKSVPNVFDFETKDADDFLENSIALLQDEYRSFTPLKINQNGYVFGESQSFEGTIALTMLNIETNEFTDIHIAKDEGTSMGVGCASDKYVIYKVINQFESYIGYYCLNLETMETDLIYEITDFNLVADETAVIYQDKAFLTLIEYDKIKGTYEYPLLEYDMKTKELSVLKDGTNGYPVIIKDKMYYIDIDNAALTTRLIQHDLNTKDEKVLAEGNDKDGYFTKLDVNENDLLIEIMQDHYSSIYKMNWDKQILTPYITLNDMKEWNCSSGYLVWIGTSMDKERMRPQYYFMDMQSNVVYHYNDSLIYFSDDGVLWNEFLTNESEIPKGQIFQQGNSQMMWKAFEK